MFEIYDLSEYETSLMLPAKCGSSSIRSMILDLYLPEDPVDFLAKRRCREPLWRKVCVVRNPYDRLVSCYLNKIKLSGRRYKGHPLNRYSKFDYFCKYVCRFPYPMNVHWSPYVPYIDSSWRILRLEDGDEMWQDLRSYVPFKEIKHENRTVQREDYRKYYFGKLQGLVGEYYRDDLELCDYGF